MHPDFHFEAGSIFISYAREDSQAVATLSDGLRRMKNLPTLVDF